MINYKLPVNNGKQKTSSGLNAREFPTSFVPFPSVSSSPHSSRARTFKAYMSKTNRVLTV